MSPDQYETERFDGATPYLSSSRVRVLDEDRQVLARLRILILLSQQSRLLELPLIGPDLFLYELRAREINDLIWRITDAEGQYPKRPRRERCVTDRAGTNRWFESHPKWERKGKSAYLAWQRFRQIWTSPFRLPDSLRLTQKPGEVDNSRQKLMPLKSM
jgi:hypothetical protein